MARAQSHFSNCYFRTGSDATVLIPAATVFGDGANTPESGDEFAVYAQDETCVGAGAWDGSNLALSIWGDNVVTAEKDGLEDGEPFVFHFWDTSTALEYTAIAVTYSAEEPFYRTDGRYRSNAIYVLASLTVGSVVRVERSYRAGWVMVGLPVGATAINVYDVEPDAIEGSLFAYDGAYYQPDPAVLRRGVGYWLKLKTDTRVAYEGDVLAENTLSLAKGWNMLSGLSCAVPLSSIIDPGGIVVDGSLFTMHDGLVSQDIIEPGVGYWLKTLAKGQVTLRCESVSP